MIILATFILMEIFFGGGIVYFIPEVILIRINNILCIWRDGIMSWKRWRSKYLLNHEPPSFQTYYLGYFSNKTASLWQVFEVLSWNIDQKKVLL